MSIFIFIFLRILILTIDSYINFYIIVFTSIFMNIFIVIFIFASIFIPVSMLTVVVIFLDNIRIPCVHGYICIFVYILLTNMYFIIINNIEYFELC